MTDTPIPGPAIPLGPDGVAQWGALAPLLHDRAKRRPSIWHDLAAYCAAYERWLAAERWLSEDGHGPVITIRDDKGNIKTHGPAPQLRISEQAAKEMTRLSRILAL